MGKICGSQLHLFNCLGDSSAALASRALLIQAETTNVCTTVDGPSKTEATERAASIIAHQHHSRVANSKKERAGSSKAARAKQMCNGTQRSNKPNRKESEEAEEVWGLEQKWQVRIQVCVPLARCS